MTSCTFNVPDLNASGDNLYGPRICWQPFIDWAWDALDFDHELAVLDREGSHAEPIFGRERVRVDSHRSSSNDSLSVQIAAE